MGGFTPLLAPHAVGALFWSVFGDADDDGVDDDGDDDGGNDDDEGDDDEG